MVVHPKLIGVFRFLFTFVFFFAFFILLVTSSIHSKLGNSLNLPSIDMVLNNLSFCNLKILLDKR